MRRLVALALVAAVAAPIASHGARRGWIMTSSRGGYDVPTAFVLQGDPLVLWQLDPLDRHDVIANDLDPVTLEPLFATEGALRFGQLQEVRGVDRLELGIWPFYCSLHVWMNGVLHVRALSEGLPAAAAN